jgi:hypothetical protein
MVERSKIDIKVIQPYYYPIIRFDRSMHQAVQRGVDAKIITSGQRDQVVFKRIFNYMLFQRLIRKGIQVF